MKLATRIIIITFTVLMAFFLFYQYQVGNPFFDEINPIYSILCYLFLGITAIVAIVKK